jgi:hypothetical protein
VDRAGHTQDERDAVAGQRCARRPHENVLGAHRDRDLEHGSSADREQDLGDREVEVEADLTDDLERNDHGGQMEARVAKLRQQNRVRPAADRERRPRGRRCGVRAHSPAPC